MPHSDLTTSILVTLAYFDVRGLPLTAEEIGLYLWRAKNGGSNEIYETLNELLAKKIIAEQRGFYFLSGRNELVETRRAAALPTEHKLRRAGRAAAILRFAPFIKAVFVCNSVAEETARDSSDIDVLIVAVASRIWITRLFANFLLRLFGLRTTKSCERDRICLSYFIDTAHLNLADWRIAPDDIHCAYWLHQMIPVYDSNGWYERFIAANSWTKEFLPNIPKARALGSNLLVEDSKISCLWRRFWETAWRGRYGDLIENEARKLQEHWLRRRLRDVINAPGNGIIIKEGIIKLHERDTRAEVRSKWQEKVKKLNEYV